jgi:predicted phage tail protein
LVPQIFGLRTPLLGFGAELTRNVGVENAVVPVPATITAAESERAAIQTAVVLSAALLAALLTATLLSALLTALLATLAALLATLLTATFLTTLCSSVTEVILVSVC